MVWSVDFGYIAGGRYSRFRLWSSLDISRLTSVSLLMDFIAVSPMVLLRGVFGTSFGKSNGRGLQYKKLILVIHFWIWGHWGLLPSCGFVSPSVQSLSRP